VISTIDLRQMLDYHTHNRALATLAVQQRPDFPISVVRRADAPLRAASGQRAEN